jgi:hypothetical protein
MNLERPFELPLLTRWMIRVIAWDGILPLVIWLLPLAMSLILPPNRREWIVIPAVVLPIAAFFIRGAAGFRYIGANYCGRGLRIVQGTVFTLAIFLMVFVDCIGMLMHAINGAPPMRSLELRVAFIVFGSIFLAYLAAMTFAMYPGKPPGEDPFERPHSEEW